MKKTRADIAGDFAAIAAHIDAVRQTVRQGHMPDMRGLDARVGGLCAALEKQPPEMQQEALPRLAELLAQLDACEAEIRAFHAALVKQAEQKSE